MKLYPKNKEQFKKQIIFTKKIMKIFEKNKIKCVIYGSFAHFYYTKDEKMRVNDIDILIKKKDFDNVVKALEKSKFRFKYYPQWETLIIRDGRLRVEIDSISLGYPSIKKDMLPNKISKIDFYGLEAKMITLNALEEIYPIAYKRTNDNKVKIRKKIKHLEKFLGRKLK